MAALDALGGHFQEHGLALAAVTGLGRGLAGELEHGAVLGDQLQHGFGRVGGDRGTQVALDALADFGVQRHQAGFAGLHRGGQLRHLQHALVIAIAAELRIAAAGDAQALLGEGQAQAIVYALCSAAMGLPEASTAEARCQ